MILLQNHLHTHKLLMHHLHRYYSSTSLLHKLLVLTLDIIIYTHTYTSRFHLVALTRQCRTHRIHGRQTPWAAFPSVGSRDAHSCPSLQKSSTRNCAWIWRYWCCPCGPWAPGSTRAAAVCLTRAVSWVLVLAVWQTLRSTGTVQSSCCSWHNRVGGNFGQPMVNRVWLCSCRRDGSGISHTNVVRRVECGKLDCNVNLWKKHHCNHW